MILAALFVALLGGQASAQSNQSRFGLPFVPVGAVYTMSNAADRNAVLIFERSFDGRLRAAGAVATGGTGSGAGLGNQGGVVLSDDERWLIAVNAGSADISVFQVQRRGLRLVSRTPSGGTRPLSVTIHRRLVYVLNAGSDSITGFRLNRQGALDPLAGSRRVQSPAVLCRSMRRRRTSANMLEQREIARFHDEILTDREIAELRLLICWLKVRLLPGSPPLSHRRINNLRTKTAQPNGWSNLSRFGSATSVASFRDQSRLCW
jgi:hypothetical protein